MPSTYLRGGWKSAKGASKELGGRSDGEDDQGLCVYTPSLQDAPLCSDVFTGTLQRRDPILVYCWGNISHRYQGHRTFKKWRENQTQAAPAHRAGRYVHRCGASTRPYSVFPKPWRPFPHPSHTSWDVILCLLFWLHQELTHLLFFFLIKKKFIYLAVLCLSCGTWDLVPWPGIEPGPPAIGPGSLSHWTSREVPAFSLVGTPSSLPLCKHL